MTLDKDRVVITGLGMIFVGLKMMSGACDDQSIRDAFSNILEKLEFPLLLEILGVIFTAIIQSSSAMTGIVIVMVGKEVMTMKNGLFITLGANVGTCVTALIGIIGANTNSKRTALIHFIFNMSGCIIFTPILWIFSEPILSVLEKLSKENAMRIAYFHLVFNITTACITTPLIKYLVKLVVFAIKDKETPKEILEWFIKEKEDKEGLLEARDSSINISISREFSPNENSFLLRTESNDDIINIHNDLKNVINRKDSSESSGDKDNIIVDKEKENEKNKEELKGKENEEEISKINEKEEKENKEKENEEKENENKEKEEKENKENEDKQEKENEEKKEKEEQKENDVDDIKEKKI